jgi:hypothetical protein
MLLIGVEFMINTQLLTTVLWLTVSESLDGCRENVEHGLIILYFGWNRSFLKINEGPSSYDLSNLGSQLLRCPYFVRSFRLLMYYWLMVYWCACHVTEVLFILTHTYMYVYLITHDYLFILMYVFLVCLVTWSPHCGARVCCFGHVSHLVFCHCERHWVWLHNHLFNHPHCVCCVLSQVSHSTSIHHSSC